MAKQQAGRRATATVRAKEKATAKTNKTATAKPPAKAKVAETAETQGKLAPPRGGSKRTPVAATAGARRKSAFQPGVWPPLGEGQVSHVLMPGGATGLTLKQVERACLPVLTDMIAAVTLWIGNPSNGGWHFGDSALLILETKASDDLSFYAQIGSGPMDTVLCEATSGEWTPAAKPLIDGEPAALIEAMGFARGGDALNFQKQVLVRNRGDAAAIARGFLRIFCKAYGYRGETPLVVTAWRERHAREAIVYDALDLDDIQKLLTLMDFRTARDEDGKPRLVAWVDEHPFAVLLEVRKDDSNRYECLDLYSWCGPAADFLSPEWMNQFNGNSRIARVVVDDEGVVMVQGSVILCGGMTGHGLANLLTGYAAAVQEVLGLKASGGGSGRRRRRPATTSSQGGRAGASPRRSAQVVH